MAIEIEKKYRLARKQYERVEADMKELGGEYVGEDHEENILYSNQMLFDKGAVVRIRKIADRSIFTFKQSIANKTSEKMHIEHETEIESADELEKILEYLNLEKRMVYEKRRKTWKFREVELVLDELPFGLYMEIEGAMMAIAEAEMFLGADDLEIEPASYPYLTKHLGKKIGNTIEARF